MRRRVKLIVNVAMLIFCGCFILWDYSTLPFRDAPNGYYGVPAISTDYPGLDMDIQQVVDDGHRIYILFISSRRIVQVYDLGGNYECTLFFYHYDNGIFALATEENTLYVEDERGNVYVFYDGVFDRFYKKEEASLYLSDIEFDWRYSSEPYEIRNGSVWKVSADGDSCLIEKKGSQKKPTYFVLIAVLFTATYIEGKYFKAGCE